MARTKWDELLPSSTTSGQSRADLVQQLARVASAAPNDSWANDSGSSVIGSATQGSAQDATEQISSLATQMTSLASFQQTQLAALQDNTQALTQNTSSKPSSGSTAGSALDGIASTVLGGGSILSPIIGGLVDLFGGSSQATAAPAPFLLPAPAQYEGGITASSPSQVTPVSYGESGQPRAQNSASSQQVNIQINALDSQSFLDHSDEIATAVKQALLNSHPLGDVISDL